MDYLSTKEIISSSLITAGFTVFLLGIVSTFAFKRDLKIT